MNVPMPRSLHAARRQPRVDLVLIADMVDAGRARARRRLRRRRAAAAAAETRGVDGRGIEISPAKASTMRRHGTVGDPGRRRHRSRRLSGRRVRLRHPVADAAGDAPAALVLEQMLRIGRHAIVSFPNFGHWRVRAQLMFNGRMPVTRQSAATPGTRRPTSISARSATSSNLCARWTRRWSAPSRSTPAAGRCAVNAPWWFWNMFGEQAVFLLRRR